MVSKDWHTIMPAICGCHVDWPRPWEKISRSYNGVALPAVGVQPKQPERMHKNILAIWKVLDIGIPRATL